MFHRCVRLCVVVLWLVTFAGSSFATTASESSVLIPLHVAAGTNLIHLAKEYCRHPDDWQEIARLNQIADPYLIYAETDLQVPLELLVIEKLSATVASVHGPVDRIESSTKTSPLQPGDQITPGQTIRTGVDGYTHLLLPGNTFTRIEPESQVTLRSLFRLKDGNIKTEFFQDTGNVIHWIKNKLRANDSFSTRTPIAVTGVRGTEFRLKARKDKTNIVETLRGQVAVTGQGGSITLNPGQGVRIQEGYRPEAPQALPSPPAPPVLEGLYRSLPVIITAPAHPTAKLIRLRLTTDSQAQTTVFDQSVAPGSQFSAGALAGGTYFASFTAIDRNNFESTVTGPFPLTLRTNPPTPIVSSPKTGTTIWGQQANIEWLAAKDVDHYEVQLATTPQFTHLLDAGQSQETRYRSPDLPPGQYYFRVRTIATDGFTTLYSIPLTWTLAPAPQMNAPKGAPNKRPILQWPAMAAGWTYDLQVADDTSFSKLIVDEHALATPSYTFNDLLAAGTYYVRIRGVQEGQAASSWTPAQTLTIKQQASDWIPVLFGVLTIVIIAL